MATDPKQEKRVEELQGVLEDLLGYDADTEIGSQENGDTEQFEISLTEALKHGDRFAIHAAKKYEVGNWASLLDLCRDRKIVLPDPKMMPNSAIVATARYAGWVDRPGSLRPDQVAWFAGPIAWILDDVRLVVEPVPMRGMLGLWTVPADIERLVLEREVRRAA